jgi:hypothetical protein
MVGDLDCPYDYDRRLWPNVKESVLNAPPRCSPDLMAVAIASRLGVRLRKAEPAVAVRRRVPRTGNSVIPSRSPVEQERNAVSGINRNVRILVRVEMSGDRTLSPLPLVRLAPRMILRWTPRPLLAILRRAVGRIGLRRSATRVQTRLRRLLAGLDARHLGIRNGGSDGDAPSFI